MINLIGAYIVTLVLAAVLIKGPKFSRISENFEKLPPFIHWALLFFLSFLTYQTMHYNSLNEYQMSFYNIPYIIIEGCNFWVHEAGHVYFMLFGEVMHFFGGTLMQVGLPFFLFLRSVKNQYRLLSTIFLFWFAQNLPHVGRYIADARAQILPLVGGGEHDWQFLLGRFGIKQYDELIGAFVTNSGLVIMIGSLIAYLWLFSAIKVKK